jgi:hypothetical protein
VTLFDTRGKKQSIRLPGDNDHEGNYVPLGDVTEIDDKSSDPLSDIRSGFKAWANLAVSIGSSLDRIDKTWRKIYERVQRNTPVDYGGATSGVFPASGVLNLILGTPDSGTRWEVMQVFVGGVDEDTTATGTAGLYVGAPPISANSRAPGGSTALADRAAQLPNPAFYGTRQLVVNDQEYLFVVVVGGTVGQTYVANFSATVLVNDAALGRVEAIS